MVKADKKEGAGTEKTLDEKSLVLEEAVRDLKKKPELKGLSDEQLKTIVQTVVVEVREIMISSSFSGPLPPSSAYDEYENTYPGSAERILTMAEENANSRRALNNKLVEADIKRANKGQILGFILSLVFIGAAILCAYIDQPFPASILGIGGFSSIISIFVLGKK